jgi:hypothetical protein
VSFIRCVGIVVRSQISFVRSLVALRRRAITFDRFSNIIVGHAGVAAGRVNAFGRCAGSFVRAVHEIARRGDLFRRPDDPLENRHLFRTGAAKAFGVAIRTFVDAPVFFVLATIFFVLATILFVLATIFSAPAPRRLPRELSTATSGPKKMNVAQAFRPAECPRAALKGCATAR